MLEINVKNFKNILQKFRHFLNNKPFLFLFVVLVLNLLFEFLFACFFNFLWCPLGDLFSGFLYSWIERWLIRVVLANAIVLILPALLGYMYIYRKGNFLKTLKLNSFFVIYILVIAIFQVINVVQQNLQPRPISDVIFGFFLFFHIGFNEDTLILGLCLNCFFNKWGKSRIGIWFSVVLNCFVFGCFHLSNLFVPGVSVNRILFQAFSSGFYCLVASAAYLRGGCIWVPIILHSANDAIILISSFFIKNVDDVSKWFSSSPDFLDVVYMLIFSLCYFLVFLFLMRKSKINELLKARNSKIEINNLK